MKKTMLIILLLLFPLVYATEYTPTVTLNCNDYEFFVSGLTTNIRWCDPDTGTHFPAGYAWNYVDALSIVKIPNSGAVWYGWGAGAWRNFAWVPDVCTGSGNNTCRFYLAYCNTCSDDPCKRNSSNQYTSVIEFTRYADVCKIPSLEILNPLPNGSIGVGGYLFNFSISNSVGWSGVSCNLKLTGTSSYYSTNFSSSTTTPFVVAYSLFPRQLTIANVRCTYQNEVGNSAQFFNQDWLVDSTIPFKIADLTGKFGEVDTIPAALYPYHNLTNIQFLLLSSFDKTDYGKQVKAILSTNANLSVLGCSGSVNTTVYPNAKLYNIPLSVSCINATGVPMNLSVYDAFDNSILDTLSFNISWVNGGITIDNINLINRISTDNLELWATISDDYYKSAIPDDAELACNYSIRSTDTGEVFAGSMAIQRTQAASNFELIQTDAYNKSVDISTDYNLSNKFNVNITCAADGYSPKEVHADRWVGYRRLKVFRCVIQPEPQDPMHSATGDYRPENYVYYSSTWETDPAIVVCTIMPDLEAEANTGAQEAVITAQLAALFGNFGYSNTSFLYLYRNINADVYSSCKNSIRGQQIAGSGITEAWNVIFSDSFLSRSAVTCMYLPISAGKVSRDLMDFRMVTNTSAYNSIVTPTTADLTFNLLYKETWQVGDTFLRIANNKTTNSTVVENNDILICTTAYYDPSRSIGDITHKIEDSLGAGGCSLQSTTKWLGNDTYEYNSIVYVNKTNCMIFSKNNKSGSFKCTARVYKYEDVWETYYSNSLPFRTSTSPAVNPNLPSELGWLIDDFIGGIVGLAQRDTLQFAMYFFMIIILMPALVILLYAVYVRKGRG